MACHGGVEVVHGYADDPLCATLAIGVDDIDHVTGLESTLRSGHPHSEERLPPACKGSCGPRIDRYGAGCPDAERDPQFP